MRKIKVSKVVFFFSLLILLTLLIVFIASQINKKEPAVSLREQYQSELNVGDKP